VNPKHDSSGGRCASMTFNVHSILAQARARAVQVGGTQYQVLTIYLPWLVNQGRSSPVATQRDGVVEHHPLHALKLSCLQDDVHT